MKHKIIGVIGVIWGGSIVARWLFADTQVSGNSAFQAGQSTAVIFGALVLAAGLYYFFKKPG